MDVRNRDSRSSAIDGNVPDRGRIDAIDPGRIKQLFILFRLMRHKHALAARFIKAALGIINAQDIGVILLGQACRHSPCRLAGQIHRHSCDGRRDERIILIINPDFSPVDPVIIVPVSFKQNLFARRNTALAIGQTCIQNRHT